ncbi:MAG: leucine-rich repeat domain-containing protein [Phycisphaerae bacterium]|nr:leucine-rich repeat domain-containing protein [Phycisphaerae bacterium]
MARKRRGSPEDAAKWRIQKAARTGAASLNLSDLGLTSLPPEIGGLANLTELDLRGNRLTSLPPEIGGLANLTALRLDGNQLTSLPPEIGGLASLTGLGLSGNQLTSLSPEIGRLANLTHLGLSRNRLTSLAPEIGGLANLTTLWLDQNQLTSVPPEIGGLANLTRLDLSGNQLASLSPEIGGLADLTMLWLNMNQLTSLPPEIGRLANLTTLWLHSNQLTSLPPEIGGLANLTTLWLHENQLTSLPPELGKLRNVKALSLLGNPLPDALIELAERDVRAALAFIRDQGVEGGEPLHEAKLVLVGEGDVGKTCLLRALQGRPFEHQPTTKGMEVAREPLPLPHPEADATIMLNAWDFGGQKDYQITHQFFFSPRSLYLVVWDPRSGHEKCDVDGWIGRIRLRVGEDATILVVATHCRTGDPPPGVNIDKDELLRKHGDVIAGFFETDSYEDEHTQRFGIDDLREAIATHAAKLRGMGDRLPPSWKRAREQVLGLAKKNTPWIAREQFTKICRDAGLADDATRGLLFLLHELGLIVYFGAGPSAPSAPLRETQRDGDRRLGDVVILMPEWLAKAVCFVIEDQETRNASGVLRYERLKKIWHDDRKRDARYEPKLYPYFLAIMEKYDVCYRLEDGRSSLVPQLIKRGRPKGLPWYPEQEPGRVPQLALSCEMDEVPPGLVPLMIVRTHRFSKEDTHWELGAFLNYHDYGTAHMALVDRELMFTVRGEYPPHFMTLLADSFEVLVGDVWPGLKARYRFSVPCPERDEHGRSCLGRLKLETLRKTRKKRTRSGAKVEETPCPECAEMLDIDGLLDGREAQGRSPEQRIEHIEALTEDLMEQAKLHASFAAEQFRLILASMHNETAAGPGMFTLLPEDGKWLKVQGKRRYRLTLWCEYPECPHPLCKIGSGGEGEYTFDRSADWLIKVAPAITWTARALKVALPITSGVIQAGLDEWDLAGLKPKLDLMEKCARAVPGGELETLGGAERPTGFFKRPEGAGLREFHDLLEAEVKGRAWGGLQRVLTKTGDYLWLCPEHYAEFEPELPKLP